MPSGRIFETLCCEYQFHPDGKIENDRFSKEIYCHVLSLNKTDIP